MLRSQTSHTECNMDKSQITTLTAQKSTLHCESKNFLNLFHLSITLANTVWF